MSRAIIILVGIVYLAINTTVQVASAFDTPGAFQQTAVLGLAICDSGLSADVAESNCERDQQNFPAADSGHCFTYNSGADIATEYRPACYLSRIISADLRISSVHPDLIKKPPRIFS